MGPGPCDRTTVVPVRPGFNGLRVPARLASVAAVAFAALAGAGFAWLLARMSKAAAIAAGVALGAVILVEGQTRSVVSDAVNQHDKTWDRIAYDWMRDGPPGAALELNITRLDDFREYTMVYQINTLWHGHPVVNGYSGWKSMLEELLGAPGSPLREPGLMAGTLRGLTWHRRALRPAARTDIRRSREATRMDAEIDAAARSNRRAASVAGDPGVAAEGCAAAAVDCR